MSQKAGHKNSHPLTTHKRLHFGAILPVSGRFRKLTTNAPTCLELLSSRKSLTTKLPGQAFKINRKTLPFTCLCLCILFHNRVPHCSSQTGWASKPGILLRCSVRINMITLSWGSKRSTPVTRGFRRLLMGNICAK